jgi:Sec-independent protein translocase protein TatA
VALAQDELRAGRNENIVFGLGLWEVLGILFVAMLFFGPKFFVSAFRSLWSSLTGFGKSFQAAANDAPATPVRNEDEQLSLPAAGESGGSIRN